MPVSRPIAVFLELAPSIELPDLIAVGDALALSPRDGRGGRRHPMVAVEDLQLAATAFHGRGARAARLAVSLVRAGVESPMETRLRLLIAAAGLPEPVIGAEIRTSTGRFLGYADLSYPELRLIIEYDGDHHRSDLAQYEKDQVRIQAFFREGFDVVRVRRRGLLSEPSLTAGTLRSAYLRARASSEMSVPGAIPPSEPPN
jgi:hypothetical protein